MPAPQVIGSLKQKGGTGATTVCVHLALAAAEAGRRVCLIDLDPQQSAASWAAARGTGEPPVIPGEAEQVAKIVRAAGHDGYDLVLLDTPPHNSPVTAAAARASDLALLTTRPSAFDLAALPATVGVLKSTRTPGLIVLNACPPQGPEVAEARELLAGLGVPVWGEQIGDRKVFRRAINTGQTVIEVEPRGKGAAEIRALWEHVVGLLDR